MENAATMGTLLSEIRLVLQGLLDAGYHEQFERIIYTASSDFHTNFPEYKECFVLFVEDGVLKYYAFDDQEDAERALESFKKIGDTTRYLIVSRVIAEMVGREHEFYQYQEAMADSDEEAVEYRQKQNEIIDFVFSKL